MKRLIVLVLLVVNVSLISASPIAESAEQNQLNEQPKERLLQSELGSLLFDLYSFADVKPQEVIESLDKLKAQVSTSNDPYIIGFYHLSKVNAYYTAEDNELFNEAVSEISRLSDNAQYNWLTSYKFYWQAIQFRDNQQFDEALSMLDLSKEAARKNRDQGLEIRSLNARGNIKTERGNYLGGIEDYIEVLKIYDQIEPDRRLGQILTNLSTLYIHTKDLTKALEINLQAIEIIEAHSQNIDRDLATLYINQSYIYGELKDTEKELAALEKAIIYVNNTDSTYLQTNIMIHLSNIHLNTENIEQAMDTATQAQTLAREINDETLYMVARTNLGAAMVKAKRADEGLAYLKETLLYFEEHNQETYLIGTYEMLAEAYSDAGQYQLAYQTYMHYHDLFTKNQFDERQEKLAAIEQKFEAEKKAREIEVLKLEKSLRVVEDERRKLIRNIFLTIFTISFLFSIRFVWVYRRTRQRNKMLKKDNIELLDKSHTDTLTGLFNRRYLEETIDAIAAEEKADESPCSLILIDIDKFKTVNDTYGHDVGDQVLTEFAKRLNTVTRKDDFNVRWGGEEFLTIAKHDPEENGDSLATRILAAIRNKPFTTSIGELQITVSAGVVNVEHYAILNKDWDELIIQVDKMLYQAKETGRDRVCIA